jgi:hypothetical protein
MAAIVLVAIGIVLILGRRELAASAIRPLFGLLLVLSFVSAALNHCGTVSCAPHPNMSWPIPIMVIGYLAVVAFLIYRRQRRAHRERRLKEIERLLGTERVRVFPPEDEEGPGVG